MVRMAAGISRMAEKISVKVAPKPLGRAAIRARSSAVRGSSGTRQIDQAIVEIDSTAPMKKASRV